MLGAAATEDAAAAAESVVAAEEAAAPAPYVHLTELKIEVIKPVECRKLPPFLPSLPLVFLILPPSNSRAPTRTRARYFPVCTLKVVANHRPPWNTAPEQRSKIGDSLSVHYIGKLLDGGAQFDTSHNRGVPFTFPIGQGNTIKGWEEGLLDMCVGEKRMLYIPYAKAYGEGGRPPVIPPKADLVFETTLMKINNKTFKEKKRGPPEGEAKKKAEEEAKQEL
ncbi:hypothetical protein DFH27DRAFT_477919 [Peziza echinospora]|nr:hypothetical protein DFH27DRAFT_477919 [Peziza echinospora]